MQSLKITNEDDETIYSKERKHPVEKLEVPFVVKDLLGSKPKEPEIVEYENIDILNDIEYTLYAEPLSPEQVWAKRQKNELHLRPKEVPVPDKFEKVKKLPANHFIQVDKNNSKVRIVGPFVDPEKVNYWREF